MVEMNNTKDAKLPAVIIISTLGSGKSTFCSKIAENTEVEFEASNGCEGCTLEFSEANLD